MMRGNIRVYHSDLWFAGAAENWELATRIIEEIGEGFDKLEKWYPEDDRTASLPMIYPSMKELSKSIDKKD